MSERVLGIDPGTAVTGYGVVERSTRRTGRLIECGVIRTPARAELAKRLQHLYTEIAALIVGHEPQVVAVESTFYAKNVRTTVSLSHARGVILLAAAQAGVRIAEFAPAAVKKTVVGRGQADKDQIGYMVMQLLRLREQPSPHDAADGIALALTYLLTSAGP